MFNIELIEYLEMIGEQIGIAVKNSLIHTRLLEAYKEIKVLKGVFPRCLKCKKMKNDEGYWQRVDEYLEKFTRLDFSHGLCPHCQQDVKSETTITI